MLTLGSGSLGERFMHYLNKHSVYLPDSKKPISFEDGEITYRPEALLLKKLPFISPDREEERERILAALDRQIILKSVRQTCAPNQQSANFHRSVQVTLIVSMKRDGSSRVSGLPTNAYSRFMWPLTIKLSG